MIKETFFHPGKLDSHGVQFPVSIMLRRQVTTQSPEPHHRDSGSASKTHSLSHLQDRQVQTAEFWCQT